MSIDKNKFSLYNINQNQQAKGDSSEDYIFLTL